MGRLRTDVSLLSFADLLQHLANTQKEGFLTVAQGNLEKSLHFGPDGMRLLSSSARSATSLGEILIRTRKITRTQLDRLLAEQKKSGRRLGEIIQEHGVITRRDIETALREQAQEEIYDLFTWTNATLEFREGPSPPPLPGFLLAKILVDASPTSILLEAARRADELSVIMKEIRNERMIPIRTKKAFSPEKLGLNPDLMSTVHALVNARSNIEEITRLSLYPRFEVLQALYVLGRNGHIKLTDAEGATAIRLKTEAGKVRPRHGAAVARPATFVPAGRHRTIALLGDMLKYRNVLAALLREAGYDVLEETSLHAVPLITGESPVSGVILDLGLATQDNVSFIAWMCENTKAPVVVLSSDPSPEAAETARRQGARAVVVKPFTREGILRTMADVFKNVS